MGRRQRVGWGGGKGSDGEEAKERKGWEGGRERKGRRYSLINLQI